MRYNLEKHRRRSTRLRGHDYSQTGGYFVTICTQGKECLFGDVIERRMIPNQNGDIARHCWFELSRTFENIRLPAFVVMPNHIHGIIIIQRQVQIPQTREDKNHDKDLTNQTREDKNHDKGLINQTPTIDLVQSPEWILMKNPSLTLGKIIRHYKAKVTTVIRKNSEVYFQWQRNYHDEVIRNNKEFEQKRKYIINNPSDWKMDEENPQNQKSPSQMRFK